MGSTFPHTFEPAPELPGSDRFTRILFGGIRRLLPRLWDVEVQGLENIPEAGPGIITPNHLSFCDSIFVPAVLPRRIWAIGKGEYMDSWKTKYVFPAMGMIPVDRSGGKAAMVALDTAAEVLAGGRLFMIYPEGTRSRSGNLHKGRTGAARLSVRCDAPIIPTGLQGTLDVQPPDQFMMKPGKKVTVKFGEPMWAHEHGDPDDPRTLRRFTDAVMFEISALSGQTYVDEYAGSTKKSEDESTATPTPTPTSASPDRDAAPARPAEVQDPDAERGDPVGRVTPRVPSVVGVPEGAVPIPTRIARPVRIPAPSVNGGASAHDGAPDDTRVTVPAGDASTTDAT